MKSSKVTLLTMVIAFMLPLLVSCKTDETTHTDVAVYAYNDADRINISVSISEKNGMKYLSGYSFSYRDNDDIPAIKANNTTIEAMLSSGKVMIDFAKLAAGLHATKPSYMELALTDDGNLNIQYVLNIENNDISVAGNCELLPKDIITL